LENRTLRIAADFPGFEYQYEDKEKCIKKVLFVCVRHPMKTDKYDLTDPALRKQLLDMGFVARVREKP
jgi:hypothetical protein